jgi:hypothetical protein
MQPCQAWGHQLSQHRGQLLTRRLLGLVGRLHYCCWWLLLLLRPGTTTGKVAASKRLRSAGLSWRL